MWHIDIFDGLTLEELLIMAYMNSVGTPSAART
jgi:hypothetical protein